MKSLSLNRSPSTPVKGSSMDALLKKLEDCEAMGMEVGRIEVSEAQAVEMDLAWKRDQAARDARKLSETVAMENLLDAIRKEGW